MIAAQLFLDACRERDVRFFTGTPCSYMKPFMNAVINDPALTFRDATNEGDAVALAAGVHVATGATTVVMFQNSGLGNAVNALTSLNVPFQIPALLIITHRAQPGGVPDEPQHQFMGEVTIPLLEALQIPWAPFPKTAAEIAPLLDRALTHLRERSLPFAIVMPWGAVERTPLRINRPSDPIGARTLSFRETLSRRYETRATRAETLQALLAAKQPDDVVITTTGYTTRELSSIADADNHLYVVGSMGSASAFALGLALYHPSRRIWMLDGDGAALMRLGNFASIGAFAPRNFFHLLIDNEAHDSTGGQATVSRGVSFGAIAQACGYAQAFGTDSLEELRQLLAAHDVNRGPTLVHFRTKIGTLPNLGVPQVKPPAVKQRLMRHLGVATLRTR
ncbi:phosphonopyruvate decarboxylase [Opitutus terrae]|uniref:Phosphonopyruvate decarboxylase n=1 Tax=Opitutus terrae (strain DSM 11246 / JCM 15787 / PB90-1) TaxID=452637 RepID=B1ZYT5_OPITP|nr:phosphonopyruvate decarboxylase [Opitutus terrae]ACB76258.1 phosphonopyruvate decarboxylase [Opitutus terrae PB90-1]